MRAQIDSFCRCISPAAALLALTTACATPADSKQDSDPAVQDIATVHDAGVVGADVSHGGAVDVGESDVGQAGPCTGRADGDPCEDGHPCSIEDRCKGGMCKAGVEICACRVTADCAPKDDGNPCNGKLYCDTLVLPYRCRPNPATVVSCQDGTDCISRACSPNTGECENKIKTAQPCDDDDPCTVGDICDAEGKCASGADLCACKTHSDCAKLGGDACMGTYYCDFSKTPRTCKINPATVIHCSTNADTDCLANVCDPKAASCAMKPAKDNAPCEDGDTCTKEDRCKDGACVAGLDTCPCKNNGDCQDKDDGNLCNGTLYCDKLSGKCAVNPKSIVSCASVDDTFCELNVCDPKLGKCLMSAVHEGEKCDDNDPCTPSDVCTKGACKGGASTCICKTDADCAAKEDGDLCNGTLYCDLSGPSPSCKLNPVTVVSCQSVDDTDCLRNQCIPKTGECKLLARPNGTACDADHNTCTPNDACLLGECKPGVNVCECTTDKDCLSKEDGDQCNGTLLCNKELAKPRCAVNPASVVVCKTVNNTACAKEKCLPKTGTCALLSVPDGADCDDGNPCTTSDACNGGVCTAKSKSCSDNSPCTFDACDPKSGKCRHTQIDCDDGNVCTKDVCDGLSGKCVGLPAAASCSDGDVCTKEDRCKAGACKAGGPTPCSDGDTCTVDGCKTPTGCTHVLLVQGSCDDGDACTAGETCGAFGCKGGKPLLCDDGDPCTADGCDSGKGCFHTKKQGLCDDGNPCTSDACDKTTGLCQHTPSGQCDRAPCATDTQCKAPKATRCETSTHTCVQCLSHKDCAPGKVCQTGACTPGLRCTSSVQCKAAGQVCSKALGMCVACISAADCDQGQVCVAHTCIKRITCKSDKQCPFVCGKSLGYCVGCNSTADCLGGGYCGPASVCRPPVCSKPGCAGATRLICKKDGSGFSAVVCDDKNACTKDVCDAVKGCGAVAVDQPAEVGKVACDDKNACTVDVCGKDGKCVHKAPVADPKGVGKVACDDKNACTVDVCGPDGKCAHKAPVADPAGVGKVACDDKNACTVDVCGEDGKCAHKAVSDGTTCGKGRCRAGMCRAVIDFSVESSHACAVTQDGKGWCWGRNSSGELGNGTSISEALPVPVSGGHKLVQIEVANAVSCGIDQAGKGWCWGYNYEGQLGNGSVGNSAGSTVPTPFKAPGKLIAIAPGGSVTCAVGTSGQVWCTGSNSWGQLGANLPYQSGSNSYRTGSPVKVLKLSAAVAVATSGTHVCAITANHKVMCWGRGHDGQLGDGTVGSGHKRSTPIAVIGLSDVTALSLRGSPSFALRNDGSVWCWGGIPPQLLGKPGTQTVHSPVPMKLAPAKDLVAFSESSGTLCGVTKSGALQWWGSRNSGIVPPRKMGGSALTPQVVTGVGKSIAVSTSGQLACALDTHGALRCWGQNYDGQLGRGVFGRGHDKPGTPALDKGAKGLWMGSYDACATDAAGVFRCWGRDYSLGFGDGVLSDFAGPTEIKVGTGVLSYASSGYYSGSHHRCLVKQDGSVWCWGNNQSGQLMNGQQSKAGDKPTLVPVKAKLPAKAVEVIVGSRFSCARLVDGRVRCYGSYSNGKQGAWVKADGPIKALAGGPSHACVIDWKKGLRCFGDRERVYASSETGKVSAGAAVLRYPGASAVAVGHAHTCFADAQGTVRCWGHGESGQIGVDRMHCSYGTCGYCSQVDAQKYCKRWFTPMLVKNGPGKVKSLCAGSQHTCAVDGNGAIWCWGEGAQGQLGDGTRTKRNVPTRLYTYPRKAVAIRCADYTTCTLDTKGGVICWGDNGSGLIGDGSAWSTVPKPPNNLP